MKKKNICAAAMTAAMTLGVVLGNGVSAYAAPEDWFEFGADREEGKQQPVIVRHGESWPVTIFCWAMSYGQTKVPGYKYVVRIPYNGVEYFDDGQNDGYSYFDTVHYQWEGYHVGDACLDDWSYSSTGILNRMTGDDDYFCLPKDLEVVIRTGIETDKGTVDDAAQILADAWMLVYDKDNNLVDSFPLMEQADVTTVPTAAVPTAATPVTAPAAEVNVPAADTVTEPVNVAVDARSSATEANAVTTEVATEVLEGKWGVGKERRVRLEAAGYNYMEVQKKVAALMN